MFIHNCFLVIQGYSRLNFFSPCQKPSRLTPRPSHIVRVRPCSSMSVPAVQSALLKYASPAPGKWVADRKHPHLQISLLARSNLEIVSVRFWRKYHETPSRNLRYDPARRRAGRRHQFLGRRTSSALPRSSMRLGSITLKAAGPAAIPRTWSSSSRPPAASGNTRRSPPSA